MYLVQQGALKQPHHCIPLNTPLEALRLFYINLNLIHFTFYVMWWHHCMFRCQTFLNSWTTLGVWGLAVWWLWQKSKPGLTELPKCGQTCKEVSRSGRKSALTLLSQQPSTHFPFPNQFPTHATTDGHPVVCISPFITCRMEGATAWERAHWRLEHTQATKFVEPSHGRLPYTRSQTHAVMWHRWNSCDAVWKKPDSVTLRRVQRQMRRGKVCALTGWDRTVRA